MICEIDFNGHIKCQIETNDHDIEILKAIDGFGNSVDLKDIIVSITHEKENKKMSVLEIKIKCIGHEVTAISEALDIAKAVNRDVTLDFMDGGFLGIHQDSNVLDLIEIRQLTIQLKKIRQKE